MSSLLNAFRQTGTSLSKESNNNRKMTAGRVAMGKSTFKGTEAEHDIVRLEKKIQEKRRMMLAVDIKIDQSVEGQDISHLEEERNRLEKLMMNLIDELNLMSSKRRYQNFMERLDQQDQHDRSNWGL